MSEFSHNQIPETELRAGVAEDALRPGGVLHDIAQNVLTEQIELNATETGNVLLPPKQPGQASEARWQLIENAAGEVKAGAEARQEEVFALAERLDMKRAESISEQDIARIEPENAVFVIEGGANRTSVVRRQLATETVQRLYGSNATLTTLYQFGSDRQIPRERKDGTPNPEHAVATEIAGDFLPAEDSLTEFGLNMASALQSGYEVVSDEDGGETAQRVVRLRRDGLPNLVLMQPHKEKGGLEDAFTAMAKLYDMDDNQFVVFTNGQYRPKDELQATQWARRNGVDMLPPVAIGDEPGYTVEHNGRQITTANRAPTAYLNEAVILERLHESTRSQE